jgi:hypothetical protein
MRWFGRFVALLCCISLSGQQIKTGPDIGSKAQDFEALDQNGQVQNLRSISGPNGMILVFYRSADW